MHEEELRHAWSSLLPCMGMTCCMELAADLVQRPLIDLVGSTLHNLLGSLDAKLNLLAATKEMQPAQCLPMADAAV